MHSDNFRVKTAGRTVQLIELMARSKSSLTFSEIADRMGMPKSSLFYLLNDMVENRYFTYDEKSRLYSKGIRMIQTSMLCMSNVNVFDEINRELRAMNEDFKQVMHAGVLDGRFITYIAKVEYNKSLSLTSGTGIQLPAHVTSLGKMLLSELSDDELRGLLNSGELERLTPYTVTGEEEFLKQMAFARVSGYAIERQESLMHIGCISVPVKNPDTGETKFAISVTMPVFMMTEDYVEHTVARLKKGAEELSIKVGLI